ncbi:hypothetical protein Hanom_Chr12g01171791 [Helianthus anomalus]
MGRLILMRMSRHIGATSPAHGGWTSFTFERGVDDGATLHNFLSFNLFIYLTFIV